MTREKLLEYVRFMAEGEKPINRVYQYILKHGRYFKGAFEHTILPRGRLNVSIIRPKKKWCYYNAQMLTLMYPASRIVEYYEGVGNCGLMIGGHAWNVYEGKVVDITWEDIPKEFPEAAKPLSEFEYFGVPIPFEFVRKHNPIKTRLVQPLLPKYLGYE